MPDATAHSPSTSPAGPTRSKGRVELAYAVQLGLTTLPRDGRSQVEEKITSFKTLQKLSKTADRGGAGGRLYIADVSPSVRAVFRFTLDGAEVVDLISKRAFNQLFGGSRPVRRLKGRRTVGTKTQPKSPLS